MDSKVNRRVVPVGDLRVTITECGSGSPLVLVHGLGGPSMWGRVVEPLGRHFHVIAVDLPGFGNSESSPSPYSAHQYAEFLHHFFSALRLKKVTLAGISYGGQIAAITAGDFPDDIERLVLIAPTGFKDHRVVRSIFLWPLLRYCIKNIIFKSILLTGLLGQRSFHDIRNRPENVSRDFLSQFNDRIKVECWLRAFRDALEIGKDWESKLRYITVPTLIVWGKNDRLLPCRLAEILKNYIPHARVRILDQCGHSLPLEKPGEVVTEMMEFSGKSAG